MSVLIAKRLLDLNEILLTKLVHSDTIESLEFNFEDFQIVLHRGRDEALFIRVQSDNWKKLEWLDGLVAVLYRDPDQRVMPVCGTSKMKPDTMSGINYFGYFHTMEPEWGNCIVQLRDPRA